MYFQYLGKVGLLETRIAQQTYGDLRAIDARGCPGRCGVSRSVDTDAFLYSLNRRNVATSRARYVSILVGSPQMFEMECRTPRQIQLANAFCRYLEVARRLEVVE